MAIARLDLYARRHQRIAAAPFAEFVVAQIRTGRKRIADGSTWAEIAPGGYLVVAPGTLLNIENLPAAEGPYRSCCLSVSRDMLSEQPPDSMVPARRWAALSPAPALDQAFAHTEQGLQESLPEALLRHRLRELLLALELTGFRPQLERGPGVTERVRLLLATAPADDWRAERVATQLAMSVATLRRRLAGEKSSFRGVLEEVRLSQALTLILSTTQPLKTIASHCGYQSPSRFAARFRQRFGTLPSAMRD